MESLSRQHKYIKASGVERQISNDQYLYNKNKTGYSGNSYWKNVELHLISTKIFLNQAGQYTYPLSPELTAVKKIRTNMKGIPPTRIPPITLFQQTLQVTTKAVQTKIPMLETVRHDLQDTML